MDDNNKKTDKFPPELEQKIKDALQGQFSSGVEVGVKTACTVILGMLDSTEPGTSMRSKLKNVRTFCKKCMPVNAPEKDMTLTTLTNDELKGGDAYGNYSVLPGNNAEPDNTDR